MTDRIFVTLKDIRKIYGCSQTTAWRKIRLMRDTLNKAKFQRITFQELANYEGIDIAEIKAAIKYT